PTRRIFTRTPRPLATSSSEGRSSSAKWTLFGIPGITLIAFIAPSPIIPCRSIGERDSAFAFAVFLRFATLLQEFGYEPGPARLMASAYASSRVSVEILVELNQ